MANQAEIRSLNPQTRRWIHRLLWNGTHNIARTLRKFMAIAKFVWRIANGLRHWEELFLTYAP
jgi:hypothetical protein